MKKIVLGLPINKNKILLGQKKRGFGVGKITLIGGKIEEKETDVDALKREFNEEIGFIPIDYFKIGKIVYIFKERMNENFEATIFLINNIELSKKTIEFSEIIPIWIPIKSIPYKKMWDDSSFWLSRVINREKISCKFTYLVKKNEYFLIKKENI